LLTKTNNWPIISSADNRPMPIVNWPIPIIGNLADNRPIISAPLPVTTGLGNVQTNLWSYNRWTNAVCTGDSQRTLQAPCWLK